MLCNQAGSNRSTKKKHYNLILGGPLQMNLRAFKAIFFQMCGVQSSTTFTVENFTTPPTWKVVQKFSFFTATARNSTFTPR